jgi:hypothetical protein
VPVGAFSWGDIVRVEVPEPVTEVGLNEELVLAGNPVRLNVTVPTNGPNGVTVTPYAVLEPLLTI